MKILFNHDVLVQLRRRGVVVGMLNPQPSFIIHTSGQRLRFKQEKNFYAWFMGNNFLPVQKGDIKMTVLSA
jgi:hypothetical protein